MEDRIKIEMEFSVQLPKKIVYARLSTVDGLSEWFADKVSIDSHNHYTFVWSGQPSVAKVMEQKLNQFIRFQWLEDEGSEYYFEFQLETDELTRDTALIVTDYVDLDESEDAISLWHKQIDGMMRHLGKARA